MNERTNDRGAWEPLPRPAGRRGPAVTQRRFPPVTSASGASPGLLKGPGHPPGGLRPAHAGSAGDGDRGPRSPVRGPPARCSTSRDPGAGTVDSPVLCSAAPVARRRREACACGSHCAGTPATLCSPVPGTPPAGKFPRPRYRGLVSPRYRDPPPARTVLRAGEGEPREESPGGEGVTGEVELTRGGVCVGAPGASFWSGGGGITGLGGVSRGILG